MEDQLNALEKAILERLSHQYPSLRNHIPFLRVRNREVTGVGMYVNFTYCDNVGEVPELDLSESAISTNENIQIDGLRDGLGYEVAITNGRLDFIEMFTYGNEVWNGQADKFTFHMFD